MTQQSDIFEHIKNADASLAQTCILDERESIIELYVTGELNSNTRAAFDEHCFNCDTCFTALQRQEELTSLIKSEGETLLATSPSAGFSLASILDFIRLPKNRLATVSLLALVAVAGYFALTMPQAPDPFDVSGSLLPSDSDKPDASHDITGTEVLLRFDSKPPAPFSTDLAPSLRDKKIDLSGGMPDFDTMFLLAMEKYQQHDYAGAVAMLSSKKPEAVSLAISGPDSQIRERLRDFNFYYGASYVGLARSGNQFSALQETVLLRQAAEYLQKSLDLAEAEDMTNIDRDRYLLALAIGLHGDKEKAKSLLQKIDLSSGYGMRSRQLLRYLNQ